MRIVGGRDAGGNSFEMTVPTGITPSIAIAIQGCTTEDDSRHHLDSCTNWPRAPTVVEITQERFTENETKVCHPLPDEHSTYNDF
jgi:hypothetical protein